MSTASDRERLGRRAVIGTALVGVILVSAVTQSIVLLIPLGAGLGGWVDVRMSRRRTWPEAPIAARAGVLGVIVGVSATVLWTEQTPDALLRAKSYAGAVLEVLFWAIPVVVLYLLLARSVFATVILGGVIAAVLTAQWAYSASDRASTAGIGPGLVGWFFLPIVLSAWHLGRSLAQQRPSELSVDHPH
jgi:hypothetical protein